MVKYVILYFYISISLFAHEIEIVDLASKLNLYGGEKATVQWRRIFSSQRHLERYHLNSLDDSTRKKLEFYLIRHAADSDQPIVPGVI